MLSIITKWNLPSNQILLIHIFENFHLKSQIKCLVYLEETDGREYETVLLKRYFCDMEIHYFPHIIYKYEKVYTFTISEPSISFNFERHPAILSGWVLHFRRSSMSPTKTKCKIKVGGKAALQILNFTITVHSAKFGIIKTKENTSRFSIIWSSQQHIFIPFRNCSTNTNIKTWYWVTKVSLLWQLFREISFGYYHRKSNYFALSHSTEGCLQELLSES